MKFLDKVSFENKRMAILIGGTIIGALFVAGIILFFTRDNGQPEEEVVSAVKITNEERVATEGLSNQLVQEFGTFGSKKDNLTGDNIGDVAYTVEESPQQASNYWQPRASQYNAFKGSIAEGSPLYYNDQIVNDWNNTWETANLIGYSVESVDSQAQDNTGKLTINGKNYKAVYVNVTFSSKETQYMVTGNDTEWNGSYNILEKGFSNNKATLTFVETDTNEWKLYSIRNLNNQFLLSTWLTPDSDAYNSTQFDFQNVGTLTPTNIPAVEDNTGAPAGDAVETDTVEGGSDGGE